MDDRLAVDHALCLREEGTVHGDYIGLSQKPFQGDIFSKLFSKFVFMLVIPDANAHIDFLQAIAGFIEDEDLMGDLAETKDITKLIAYLKENM